MNLRVNKYRNQPTEVDNIRFDSKREAKRYQELRLLERAKVIKDLQLQQRFELRIKSILICTYIADFVYYENGAKIVEDVKGIRTREYILKKKLVQAIYGIEIKET